ncbi:hypothetical protein EDM68_02765 [Candidatus Uhrbacteria bacterium]|nr:MAG: hypothetical protein EDM68_02765 [Candidatus Uhrbacteria bacterium]
MYLEETMQGLLEELDRAFDHRLFNRLVRTRPGLSHEAIVTAREVICCLTLNQPELMDPPVCEKEVRHCETCRKCRNAADDLINSYFLLMRKRGKL